MMKKIILLCSLMVVSFGYSQSLPIDFEDPLDANMIGGDSGVFASGGGGGQNKNHCNHVQNHHHEQYHKYHQQGYNY